MSNGLPQKSELRAGSAEGAEDMKARGKHVAKRSASPLGKSEYSFSALKERNNKVSMLIFRTFSACNINGACPGATHFASLRACPWLSYYAPLALPARNSDF